jgi:adenylate cyclase
MDTPEADFESELSRRMLLSEVHRARILARVLSGLTAVSIGYGGFAALRGHPVPGFGWMAPLVILGCAYEWFATWLLTQAVRRNLQPARFRFYLNAVVELSIPTASILIFAAHGNPINALTGPASYLYFLFIILSALRLDFRLSVFTGAVAAALYTFAIALHWSVIAAAFDHPGLQTGFFFAMRVLLLLLGGVVAALVSASIRTTLIETTATIRERERIVSLFGQHVSPEVVTRLLAQPTGPVSDLLPVCVLVLDIRRFTTFSEGRPADDVVAYLNTLWTFMVRTINEHHGIVNKFLGDGFLAVFGAPISAGNDCANALAAARRILEEVDELVAAGKLPRTRVGMALHAGEVIVGNIGSAERKEYTIIGDVVNVAFRIEALNKDFDSRLLISEAVRRAVGIADAERLPPVPIRGRQELMELSRVA